MSFEEAFRETLGIEGGYVNDPQDQGRETYKGVSRRFHPLWMGWVIIDAHKGHPDFPQCLEIITELQDALKNFYRHTFWDAMKLDEVADHQMAAELFDTAVNCGQGDAVLFAQRAVNFIGREGVAEDGKFGPMTLAAINKWCRLDPKALFIAMNGEQYIAYKEEVRNNPTQSKYSRGWMKRIQSYRKV